MPDVQIDTTNFNLKKQIVLEKWGEILKQGMITRCPREYGDMVASIEMKKGHDEVEVGTNGIDYASFVEWGTGPMKEAHGRHLTQTPVKTWEALRKRKEEGTGQTMPFARTAHFFGKADRQKVLREAFR